MDGAGSRPRSRPPPRPGPEDQVDDLEDREGHRAAEDPGRADGDHLVDQELRAAALEEPSAVDREFGRSRRRRRSGGAERAPDAVDGPDIESVVQPGAARAEDRAVSRRPRREADGERAADVDVGNAGVIATRPATAPWTAPTTDGAPLWNNRHEEPCKGRGRGRRVGDYREQ